MYGFPFRFYFGTDLLRNVGHCLLLARLSGIHGGECGCALMGFSSKCSSRAPINWEFGVTATSHCL